MTPPVRLDVDAPFAIWSVDLSPEPDRGDAARLSAAEQARAARFRFPRDRRRYVNAHVALRELLAEGEWAANDFGKPALGGRSDFNLSYAGELALIAIGDGGAIGVDAETLRAIPDTDITDDIFDAAERAAIAREPAGMDRNRAFLRAWTRKEACVKAAGTGLSTPPATVAVGVGTERRRLDVSVEAGRTTVEVGSFEFGDRVAAWARVL